MRTAFWSLLWFALLAAGPAFAETVNMTDNLSVNGSLTKMSNGVITLEARSKPANHPPVTQTLSIPISKVKSIEFNYTTFNTGPSQIPFGINPRPPKAPEQPSTPDQTDQIVLVGGVREDCKLIGIDGQFIRCAGKDGKDKVYQRKFTLRILLGAR
jgi:hypothetical protein